MAGVDEVLRNAREAMLSGRYDESLEGYLKALEAGVESVSVLNALGFLLYFKGDYVRGLEYCERAVEISPDDAYARKGLGLHLAKLGRKDDAVASVLRAIELDPDFIDAYHDLAFIYYESGDFASAREWLKRGVERCRDVRGREMFERFFRRLDDISQKGSMKKG